MYRIHLFPKAFTKVSCLAASSPVVISMTHQFSLFSFVLSENSCFIHSENVKIRFFIRIEGNGFCQSFSQNRSASLVLSSIQAADLPSAHPAQKAASE